MSTKIDFAWSYSDPAHPTVFFRIYENAVLVIDNVSGTSTTYGVVGHALGSFTYYVTAVDSVTLMESVPSESVTVNFTEAGDVPAAPTGLTYLLS